jgi:hypothetical protein
LPLRNLHFDVPVFSDPAQHPLLWAEEALSMPVPLVKRWTKRYGTERALELARNALVEPDLCRCASCAASARTSSARSRAA